MGTQSSVSGVLETGRERANERVEGGSKRRLAMGLRQRSQEHTLEPSLLVEDFLKLTKQHF